MKNVLVTGAKGQLASEIKNLSKVGGRFKFFFLSKSHLDITNKSQLENFFERKNIDVLINCAAVSKPDKAALDPDLADLLNNISVNKFLASTVFPVAIFRLAKFMYGDRNSGS